jgi:hypothetical protein
MVSISSSGQASRFSRGAVPYDPQHLAIAFSEMVQFEPYLSSRRNRQGLAASNYPGNATASLKMA